MSANEVHVGDVGTRITLTMKDGVSAVDISGASVKQIWIADPLGVVVKNTAIFTSDGSDGKIYYDTVTATFDAAGDWQVQGYVETVSGTWHSDIKTLEVFENVE